MPSFMSLGQESEHRASEIFLLYSHYITGPLLLVLFIISFITQTILAARKLDDANAAPSQTGPGGKPLPRIISRRSSRAAETIPFHWSASQFKFFLSMSAIVLLSLLINATIVILHALEQRSTHWWCGQAYVVYITMTCFVFSVVMASLRNLKATPNRIHLIIWSSSLLLETSMLACSIDYFTHSHRQHRAFDPNGGRLTTKMTIWEACQLGADLVRVISLLILVSTYVIVVRSWQKPSKSMASGNTVDETAPLLNGNSSHKYGERRQSESRAKVKPRWARPEKLPEKSWWEYVRGYSLFLPYLWPNKSRRLQLAVFLCFILLILGRIVNVLVPTQAGRVTNLLAGEDGHDPSIPWVQISLYILFRLLQGSSGLLSATRTILFLPISQYSSRELSVAAFEHVHGLSLDFHLGKRTGEVLSALNKGNSISSFLQQVTFDVLPMLVDLVIAIVFFISRFDVYYGLIVTLTAFTYLYVTVLMAQARAELRRDMTNQSRIVDSVKSDSLYSYETVKYFNAEAYEFDRYRGVFNDLQHSELKVIRTLQSMNLTQNLLFMIGVLGVCFLSAFEISTGRQPVGQFVIVLTYMSQLQAPLNYFGTMYRSIQSQLISAERMLELFKETATMQDSPSAEALVKCRGDIGFENVSFSYDPRRKALRDLNFTCKAGTTTAFVGESGGGKSTIFRLLYRFYNLNAGQLTIDGRNVKDVTIDSLRRHIGVVPQDTVLFNETIMYNLKYSQQSASDEQVYAACRAASIHDRILTFPDGYASKVGERGLKLSGGEKQRIAIARTILKDPTIILLDEATAALDTATEQNIQGALDILSKGRTSLIIAHRLSTITTADQILVLQQGEIVERGDHQSLLDAHGVYAKMWERQIQAQKAAAGKMRKEFKNGDDKSKDHGKPVNGNVALEFEGDLEMDNSHTTSDDDELHRKNSHLHDTSGSGSAEASQMPSRSPSGLRMHLGSDKPNVGDKSVVAATTVTSNQPEQ